MVADTGASRGMMQQSPAVRRSSDAPNDVKFEASSAKVVRIKRDGLSKPLLRIFRKFVRNKMESQGRLKGHHFWSVKKLRSEILSFMKQGLELPQHLCSEKNQMSMILLVLPAVKGRKKEKGRSIEELEHHLPELSEIHDTFGENSEHKRKKFFGDPLMQELA